MTDTRKDLRELDCSNLSLDWKNWKRDFLVYMIAKDKNKQAEPTKIANFLWLIGTKGANIYNTLFQNDGSQDALLGTVKETVVITPAVGTTAAVTEEKVTQRTLDEVLKAFDAHCLPQKNVTMESYNFNNIVQKERQPFNEFLTEIRAQIDRCEFKCACGLSYENRMLRDRIITGVFDKKLQLKLLDGRDEKLDRVVDICKTFESANVHKSILSSKQSTISAIASSENIDTDSINAINTEKKRNLICFNCGGEWNREHKSKCPARDYTCQCGKKGHFRRMCRKKSNKSDMGASSLQSTSRGKPRVNQLNWNDDSSEGNIVNNRRKLIDLLRVKNSVFRINSIGSKRKRWTKAYRIGNKLVKFKVDTGADVNCIPLKIIKKMEIKMKHIQNDFPVFDYSNNKIKIYGIAEIKMWDSKLNIEKISEFIVVDDTFEPILGLETCIEFGLIEPINIDSIKCSNVEERFVNENNDVFTGLGKIPGKVKIYLKEDAKPVIHYKKRFPDAIVKKLRSKLDELVESEIISPVSHPTDWVNNLQIVEKSNGDLRICLDPKPLNKCLKREHYLIPTLDDMISELVNKKIFTVLDCSNGFWQLEVDEKSSELTTFMTPFGRYKFNRLAQGLNISPEIFQRRMVQIFGDIPGVFVYFDDIGIVASNEEEHDKILAIVLERARLNNVKFNPNKIQYRKTEVKFMGHILSDGAIRPSMKHIEAILKMKRPTDKHGVSRLMGLFKWLAKFIPNLSKFTAELRLLSGKDIPFEWNEKHEAELDNLKKIITSDPVLKPFDPQKPFVIQTDASKDGLGSGLIQEEHPIAFASRTLSKCEQRWAQIEKELLAVVFACERFKNFIYGHRFIVESDHKPLETLNLRDIDGVTPRLQRMFMRLLKFPGLEIVYKPGKSMLLADCLSRAQLDTLEGDTKLNGIVHAITKSVCVSRDNYEYYKQILASDEDLRRVCEYVRNGWPNYRSLNEFAQKFHKLKSELHFENGLLFRNHRLVIPNKMQRKMAKWLHEPHLGIEKTLARARMLYFWPGMNAQIKEMIASCNICEKFKRNNQKEPLVQEMSPKYPYHIVSVDLFEYAGRDFISIFDAYSNYLVATKVNNKTSVHIIDVFCSIFNKIGYPTIIKSDNVPFNSSEFEKFSRKFNVQFKYSSPRYPQSNGLAEKGVAIAKNILKRCYETNGVDQYQYRILEYNTTPVAGMQMTPSELFFGRLVKTGLPMSEQLLVRNNMNEETIQEKIKRKKEKQKYYYDRNVKSLPSLNLGDMVIFKKNGKEWHYGKIVGIVSDRSYIIKDPFDNYFRRNRRFIAKTKNEDFSASDLLFEENVKSGELENLPEIKIVKPVGELSNNTNVNDNQITDIPTNNVIAEELDLSVDVGNNSASDYDTAEGENSEVSSGSESDENSQHDNPTPITTDYKTRSGRTVRPPQRYGW